MDTPRRWESTIFVHRLQRWIDALVVESCHGGVVTVALNFAYEWAAQPELPAQVDYVDLCNVVLIIGSEPVNSEAVMTFNKAFGP